MYSLVCPSDSPPGGGRTVPRTVSRTALREDTRTAPRAKDRTYDLSTGLHTYDVSYSSLVFPDVVVVKCDLKLVKCGLVNEFDLAS